MKSRRAWVCPTSYRRYWDLPDDQRALLCGDAGGPRIHGIACVCMLDKGHDGPHRDHWAEQVWTGSYCPACCGSGRVKETFGADHAGSTRYPREWDCEECNGTGRKAA